MRVVYLTIIVTLILISLPVMVGVSFLIVMTSGLPVFFRQKRTGKNGRPFTIYKFRTMVMGAEAIKSRYSKLNEAKGPVFKIKNDPRFTPVGRFLSHTGLDELPQLWNVLRGEMALIGPRPLPVVEAAGLKPWMQKRHSILPGIISPWILDGYHRRTFTEWMKSDIAYIEAKSVGTDIGLFFRSVGFMMRLLWHEIL